MKRRIIEAVVVVLLFASTGVAQTQNCDALNLSTKAISLSQVRQKALAVWGSRYFVEDRWRGDRTYSIKIVGYYRDFLDYDMGFRGGPALPGLPTPLPPRQRTTDEKDGEMGRSERGSWIEAWNKAMVKWCKEGGKVIP